MVLRDLDKLKERWRGYYENLLNQEHPRVILEDEIPNQGVTPEIGREEVNVAVKKMKNGKSTGPDSIPVGVWKSQGEDGTDILWDVMKRDYEQEETSAEWRDSIIVPICKEKSDIQDCRTY